VVRLNGSDISEFNESCQTLTGTDDRSLYQSVYFVIFYSTRTNSNHADYSRAERPARAHTSLERLLSQIVHVNWSVHTPISRRVRRVRSCVAGTCLKLVASGTRALLYSGRTGATLQNGCGFVLLERAAKL
jgi:hypothetical protein